MAKHVKNNPKRQGKNKQRMKEHVETQKESKKAAKSIGIASGAAEVMASPLQAPREGDDEYDHAPVAQPTADLSRKGTNAVTTAAKGGNDWKDSLILDFGRNPVPGPRSSPWSIPAAPGSIPEEVKVVPGVDQQVSFTNDFFAGFGTGVNIAGKTSFPSPEVTGGRADTLFGTGQLVAFSFLPTTSPLGSSLANFPHRLPRSITGTSAKSPSRPQAEMSGSSTPFKFEIPAKYRKSMFSAPTPGESGTGSLFQSSSQPRLQHPQNMAPAANTVSPAVSPASPFAGSPQPAKIKSILDPEVRKEAFDTSLPWARLGTTQPTSHGESSYDPSKPFPSTVKADSESTEDGTTDDSSLVSESPTPTRPQGEPQALFKHPDKFNSFLNDYMNCKYCGGVHFGKCTAKEGSMPTVESKAAEDAVIASIISSPSLGQGGDPTAQVGAVPVSALHNSGDDSEPEDDKFATDPLDGSKDLDKISNSQNYDISEQPSVSDASGSLAPRVVHETPVQSSDEQQLAAPVCVQKQPGRDEDSVGINSTSIAANPDTTAPTPNTIDASPTQPSEQQADVCEDVFVVTGEITQQLAAETTNAQSNNETRPESPISTILSPFALPLFTPKTSEAHSTGGDGHKIKVADSSDLEHLALPSPVMEANVTREGEASSTQTGSEIALGSAQEEPLASHASPAAIFELSPTPPAPSSQSPPSSTSAGSSKEPTPTLEMAPYTPLEKEDGNQGDGVNETKSTIAHPVRDLPVLSFSDELDATPEPSKQTPKPYLDPRVAARKADLNKIAIALLRHDYGASAEQGAAEAVEEAESAGDVKQSTDVQAGSDSQDADDNVGDVTESGDGSCDSAAGSSEDGGGETEDDKTGTDEPEDDKNEVISSGSESEGEEGDDSDVETDDDTKSDRNETEQGLQTEVVANDIDDGVSEWEENEPHSRTQPSVEAENTQIATSVENEEAKTMHVSVVEENSQIERSVADDSFHSIMINTTEADDEDETMHSDDVNDTVQIEVSTADDGPPTSMNDLAEAAAATEPPSADHDDRAEAQTDAEIPDDDDDDDDTKVSKAEEAQLEGSDSDQSDSASKAGNRAAAGDIVDTGEHTEEAEAIVVNEPVNEDSDSGSQPQCALEDAAESFAQGHTTSPRTPLDSQFPHSVSHDRYNTAIAYHPNTADSPASLESPLPIRLGSERTSPLSGSSNPPEDNRAMHPPSHVPQHSNLASWLIGIVLLLIFSLYSFNTMVPVSKCESPWAASSQKCWDYAQSRASKQATKDISKDLQRYVSGILTPPAQQALAQTSEVPYDMFQWFEIIQNDISKVRELEHRQAYLGTAVVATSMQVEGLLNQWLTVTAANGFSFSPFPGLDRDRAKANRAQVVKHMRRYVALNEKTGSVRDFADAFQMFSQDMYSRTTKFLRQLYTIGKPMDEQYFWERAAETLCTKLPYRFWGLGACSLPVIYDRREAFQHYTTQTVARINPVLEIVLAANETLEGMQGSLTRLLTSHEICPLQYSPEDLSALTPGLWYEFHSNRVSEQHAREQHTIKDRGLLRDAVGDALMTLFFLLKQVQVDLQMTYNLLVQLRKHSQTLSDELRPDAAAMKLARIWVTQEGRRLVEELERQRLGKSKNDPAGQLYHIAANLWVTRRGTFIASTSESSFGSQAAKSSQEGNENLVGIVPESSDPGKMESEMKVEL